MAKHGMSARSPEHMVRAQTRDSDRRNKERESKSGKSIVSRVLDAAAHLGR